MALRFGCETFGDFSFDEGLWMNKLGLDLNYKPIKENGEREYCYWRPSYFQQGFHSIVHRNTSTFDGWVHRLNRTKMDLKKGGLKQDLHKDKWIDRWLIDGWCICVCIERHTGNVVHRRVGREWSRDPFTVALYVGVRHADPYWRRPDRRTERLGEAASQIGNHGKLVRA